MKTDEELALGIQKGQLDCLTELVGRHQSPLTGFVFRMTGGKRDLTEEIIQEAFLRVLRGIEHYHYPRPFKAWLYAIATNLVRDHFKRAEQRYVQHSADETLVAPTLAPETSAIMTDEAEAVVNALMTMPEGQRAALVLRYYDGLSHQEIAQTLDIPIGTVKSRVSNGLNHLRVLLEEYQ